jgi:hypothetical protein
MSELELTPRGRARREQILNMAIQQARRRRRRRWARRGGAAAIALLVIGLATLHIPRPVAPPLKTNETTGTHATPPKIPTPSRAPSTKVVIERIQTDPTITRRLAVPQTPPRWERLDDDRLLQELAKAGKPAGLVKIDGRVTLVFHHPSP